MKKVEFLARFNKKKKLSDEDKAYIAAQRMINLDNEHLQDDEMEIGYDPIVIDLYEISDFLRFDEEHVQIMKKSNVLYIVKMDYEKFLDLYQELTGFLIYRVEEVND